MRSFIAELTNLKTSRVLARTSSAIYDLRSLSNASPYTPQDLIFNGMSAQITDAGLGYIESGDTITGLEPQFHSMLPEPSLEDFNKTLTANARALPRYDDNGNVLRACIDYANLTESKFWNPLSFPAYGEAYAKAVVLWNGYEAAKAVCDGMPAVDVATIAAKLACYLALTPYCIKNEPQKEDFQLCVDQIEGSAESLTIDQVAEVALNFEPADRGGRGLIDSHISLSGIDGRVNAYLRSLSVEWKSSVCLPQPNATSPDSLISDKDHLWLKNWTTCNGIAINNTLATTVTDDTPGRYQVKQDPNQSERLEVTAVSDGTFDFAGPSLNANKGICQESFINPSVVDMARTFRSSLQSTLQAAWYAGSPHTQEATVLTKILSPYRVGETSVLDHNIQATYKLLSSDILSGLRIEWNNTVTSTVPSILQNLKQLWFRAPPRAEVFSATGEDVNSRPFDFSFTVRTELLNKVLNVRAASPDTLHFIYEPTWAELASFGVAKPRRASSNAKAPLNASTLRQFDSAFRGLGNKVLEIKVRPTYNPIVFMPPDLDPAEGIGPDAMPTTYGIHALEVLFKEKDRRVGRRTVVGKTWLRLLGGFTDEDFNFTADQRPNGLFLRPHINRDMWSFRVDKTSLLGCRMYLNDSSHPFTCEGRLEAKIAQLMAERLRGTFLEMVEEIPAPQFFDAEGDAPLKFIFDPSNKAQSNQNITFYGEIDLS